MNYILLLSMLILNSNVSWLCAYRDEQNYKCYVHVCQLKLVGIQPLKQSAMCNFLLHALQFLNQELKQLNLNLATQRQVFE